MEKRISKPYNIKLKNKKKKIKRFHAKYNIIMALVFLIFIFGSTIFNIIKSDKEFSAEENRNLSKKPKFTFESFINGDFSKEYTDYLSDQFIGRSSFVAIKGKFDNLQGKSSINNVYIGKDDQLLEKFTEASEDVTKEKINAINNFFKENNDLKTSFMLVPTASKVLEEKLPKYAPMDDELKYMDKIQKGIDSNIKFINPYKDLHNNKDEYIFYRTDHHWTSKGAYISYLAMAKELELEPKKEEDFTIETVSDSFYGSLSSKIGVMSGKSDEVEIYNPKDDKIVVNYEAEQKKATTFFNSEALDKKDKYEVFTGGNHAVINIKTLGDPEKKLLIIKDSYANSFIPFLTSHYGEINVVDLRYYTDDLQKLIKAKEITDVMFLYNVNTFNTDDSILNLTN